MPFKLDAIKSTELDEQALRGEINDGVIRLTLISLIIHQSTCILGEAVMNSYAGDA